MGVRGHPSTSLLVPLADRSVPAGGGGPISNEELYEVLPLPPKDGSEEPVQLRVKPLTVMHSDSARTYFNLGWKEALLTPADSKVANKDEDVKDQQERFSLQNQQDMYYGEIPDDIRLASLLAAPGTEAPRTSRRQEPTWAAKYSPQIWMHTAVVHKREKNFKKQFLCFRKIVLPSGRTRWVKGGTHMVGGHWRMLKRAVTRSCVNTKLKGRLREMVRSHQWRFWTQGQCRFAELGKVLAEMKAKGVQVQFRSTPFFRRAQAQRRIAVAKRERRRERK